MQQVIKDKAAAAQHRVEAFKQKQQKKDARGPAMTMQVLSSSTPGLDTFALCRLHLWLLASCQLSMTHAPVPCQDRASRWAAVGIATLRDEQLSSLPSELWSIGPSIRVADFGSNKLTSVPASLSAFSALQRLRLSHNQLSDEGIPWHALTAMPQLAVLALDHNRSAYHTKCASTGH